MAARHRAARRAKRKPQRSASRHLALQSPSPVSKWLGKGAVAVGFCASLANVAGIAHADSGGPSPSSHSSHSSNAGATGSSHAARPDSKAGSAGATKAIVGTAPTSTAGSAGSTANTPPTTAAESPTATTAPALAAAADSAVPRAAATVAPAPALASSNVSTKGFDAAGALASSATEIAKVLGRLPSVPWTGSLADFVALWVGNGTAAHPDAGLIIGNGYSYGTVTGDCATTCNGGDAGLFGNGGNGFGGGNGGDAILIGNGGNGGPRPPATVATAATAD